MFSKIIASIPLIVLMVYMLRKRINMGWIMLVVSGLVILTDGLSVYSSVLVALHTVSSYKTTISLVVVMYLIILLENIMQEKGMISKIVSDLKQIAGSNRVTASLLSAVIGLLPSLGGARFSCPLVNESVGKNGSNETKAFVNTWYRHVLMDGFILYPGIILAAAIMNVSIAGLFSRLLAFIAITAVSGIIFGTIKIKFEKSENIKASREGILSFLLGMSPIIAVIALYMSTFTITAYSMEISLLTVNIALMIVYKYNIKQLFSAIKKAFILKYIIIIAGVMIFKNILMTSSFMGSLPNWVETLPIPKQAFFILIPLMAGALTGMSVGIVSIAFPILLSLGLKDNLWYGAIAYASGQVGQMLTPLHLCNIITAEYFKVPLSKLLIRIAKAEFPVILALILFLIFIS